MKRLRSVTNLEFARFVHFKKYVLKINIMETNIKLVQFGKDLHLFTKVFTTDIDLSIEQLQKICTNISSTGVAAIPFKHEGRGLIITDNSSFVSANKTINIDDWVVNL